MIEARVRDFRIDARLRRACGAPMMELCGGMDSYEGDETDMNLCLQVCTMFYCHRRQMHTRPSLLYASPPCSSSCSSPCPLNLTCHPRCTSLPHASLSYSRVARATALQDSVDLIPPGPCRTMVYEYQQLAAQDIRFDVPLADACIDDRRKFCSSVPPVRILGHMVSHCCPDV